VNCNTYQELTWNSGKVEGGQPNENFNACTNVTVRNKIYKSVKAWRTNSMISRWNSMKGYIIEIRFTLCITSAELRR